MVHSSSPTPISEEINAISEKLNFPYGEEHFITVVDYDQDGKQDILVFGQTGFKEKPYTLKMAK